jgi:hypothetical protein
MPAVWLIICFRRDLTGVGEINQALTCDESCRSTPSGDFGSRERASLFRGGFLDSGDLAGGLEFDGKRIPIVRPPSMPSRNGEPVQAVGIAGSFGTDEIANAAVMGERSRY